MCGILGGNGKWNYKKGLESIRHRGPDGQKIIELDGFTLAFARLSIIDVGIRGMQPMITADGQVGIVFNGEIYGYKRLRRELIQEFELNSETDTEVLLYMYLKYGREFVDKIDGIFSFAILDKRSNELLLYRDRLGIKPLYYYYLNGDFIFSSEIKGIIETFPNANLELDNTALYDYMTYSYIPHPKSLYKHIKKLEPAHYLVFNLNKKKIVSNTEYWHLIVNSKEDDIIDRAEAIAGLRNLIKESVEEQMVADVPVGVMTSGGVDSSIITYECSRINPQIETFTIKNTDIRMDESKYAKVLVNKLGLPENIIPYGTFELKGDYELLSVWFDEPIADRSAYLSSALSKDARKKVKVLLSGDGADEVFGGYSWLFSLTQRLPYKYKNEISSLYEKESIDLCFNCGIEENDQLDDEYLDDISWYCKKHGYMLNRDKKVYRYLWNIPSDYDDYWAIRKYYYKDLPPITRLQIIEMNTYLPYILNKVDITSMINSLEVRVPFLSRKVVEYSFSLPQNIRYLNNISKGLLKQSYNELPAEILNRPKMGFDISEDWFGYGKRSHEVILRQLWGELLTQVC